MFDFGLYTQMSDSGPHGPLVFIKTKTTVLCSSLPYLHLVLKPLVKGLELHIGVQYCEIKKVQVKLYHSLVA